MVLSICKLLFVSQTEMQDLANNLFDTKAALIDAISDCQSLRAVEEQLQNEITEHKRAFNELEHELTAQHFVTEEISFAFAAYRTERSVEVATLEGVRRTLEEDKQMLEEEKSNLLETVAVLEEVRRTLEEDQQTLKGQKSELQDAVVSLEEAKTSLTAIIDKNSTRIYALETSLQSAAEEV